MTRYVAMTAKFLMVAVFLLQSPPPVFGQQAIASYYYDERGSVVRHEKDTNGDGKMDRWTYYNRAGPSRTRGTRCQL